MSAVLTPRDIQIDREDEDDGLYIITFWFDADPPRYVTLARDAFEEPDEVYVEFIDQKYGFKTRKAGYVLRGGCLTLDLGTGTFVWLATHPLRIAIPATLTDAVATTLQQIFDLPAQQT